MSDCLFCKIAAGEIPSDKVYENDDVLAFNDINPQAPVHILVIPKTHIDSVGDVTPENSHIAAKCLEAVAEIAKKKDLKNGFRLISNCGEDAGQNVKHMHFHIIAGIPLDEKVK